MISVYLLLDCLSFFFYFHLFLLIFPLLTTSLYFFPLFLAIVLSIPVFRCFSLYYRNSNEVFCGC